MKEIAETLLEWHENIDRDLPWKSTGDPYFIWLSEVIMQQTRVAQGTPYYNRFTESFPTITHLAQATQEEVYKLWEGLGYYSRARNLHAAAKMVVNNWDSIFPQTYNEIIKLPGVGPYTAAAISSFAFDENHAVLDGNVFRVLSRLFDIETDILSSKGKKEFTAIAQQILPKGRSADYNQAIMDFGALHCIPQKPQCSTCPLHDQCEAYRKGVVESRPVKKKAKKKVLRYMHFLDTRELGFQLVEKRVEKDVWQGLHQLPMIETDMEQVVELDMWKNLTGIDLSTLTFRTHALRQLLSHQDIRANVIRVINNRNSTVKKNTVNSRFNMVGNEDLEQYAFPRILNTYFEKM